MCCIAIPAATETFNDSISFDIWILTTLSSLFLISSLNPFSSDPIKNAKFWLPKSKLCMLASPYISNPIVQTSKD